MIPGRRGIALPLVLFLLLALSLLTGGLLLLAAQQAALAGARVSAVRARFAAGSAARAALVAWRTGAHRDLGVGKVEALPLAPGALPPHVEVSAVVRRLAGPRYMISARGRVGPPDAPAATARAALIVRVLDPLGIWRDFPAALTLGGLARVEDGAVVSTVEALEDPPFRPPDDCPPDAAAKLAAVFGRSSLPGILVADERRLQIAPGAVIEGTPAVSSESSMDGRNSFTRLGPLSPDAARRVADRIEQGEITPIPRVMDSAVGGEAKGECDKSAPANWGAPRDPTSTCGGYLPLIFAPGNLTMTGGAGQGILIVDGDLTLAGDAEFHGLVIVRGRVELTPGSSIHGALRAGSFDDGSIIGGQVSYSVCAIHRVMSNSRALNRPYRPAARWWIPVF